MSPEAGDAVSPDDPLYLVALAVRSRSGAWIGVENMAGRCRSYLQGHRVHHIQIGVVYAGTPAQRVTIAGIDGDVITVEEEGATRRLQYRLTSYAMAMRRSCGEHC